MVVVSVLLLGAVASAAPESYRIVHLAPLTGDASFQGQILVNAARMAVDEINANGGINGVPIEYLTVDETSSTATGIEAVRKAIDLNPVAVIGPNRSGTILAAEDLWRQAQIPFITDGTNAETTRKGNPYTFRIQIASTYWIPILAHTAKEYYGVEKAAIIYGTNEYSKGLFDATAPALEQYGIEQAIVQTYNDGDRDFTAQLLRIKASGAQALFTYGYEAEIGMILRQRMQLGMGDLLIFGERGCSSPAVAEVAGLENIEGLVASTTLSQADPDPKRQAFIKKYAENFPNEPMSPTHVNHYDSIYILADIIGRVGDDRDKIREELANLDYEGTLAHYRADGEGNLVHTIYTQVFRDGQWELLLEENHYQNKICNLSQTTTKPRATTHSSFEHRPLSLFAQLTRTDSLFNLPSGCSSRVSRSRAIHPMRATSSPSSVGTKHTLSAGICSPRSRTTCFTSSKTISDVAIRPPTITMSGFSAFTMFAMPTPKYQPLSRTIS